MTHKVSVIIPVYNAEDYLGQCMDSILMQTFEDIEVICVDDGSKDDSLGTLQGYAFLDARLTVLSQEHKGPNAARNLALSQASGEYVLFLEANDFFEPDMLEKMIMRADADQSDVVVAGHYVFDNTLKQITNTEQISTKLLANPLQRSEDFGDSLFSFCEPFLFNRLIRRDIFTKNNIHFSEDIFLLSDQSVANLSLACADKISLMPEVFVSHRIRRKMKENGIEEIFPDLMKSFGNLYRELKRLSLSEKFQMPYLQRLRMVLFNGLQGYSNFKKQEALRTIKKYIPPEIIDALVPYNNFEAKISVIIPVYNAESYIAECLDSVLNQTLKEIEVICVDDGSVDNSLTILNAYAQKDNRVQVLTQENAGQGIARNKALKKARGTYIQFLDSDDYLEPDACEYLYFYAQFLRLDMLSFSAKEFRYADREEFENPYHCLSWLPEYSDNVFNWKILGAVMPHLTVSACLTIYRRFFLLKNNIQWMNQKLAYEDTPFFVDSAFKTNRMGALKFPCYHRRVHKSAITQQLATNFPDLIFVTRDIFQKVKKLATREVFVSYYCVYLQKAWGNYVSFEPEEKVKYASLFYDFCMDVAKKYHLPLPALIQDWCLRNMGCKSKWQKFRIKTYLTLLKGVKNRYFIPLFDMQLIPEFSVSILGLPIVAYLKQEGIIKRKTLKLFGLNVFEVQEYIE